jgi:parallel beta-helix repeat protein
MVGEITLKRILGLLIFSILPLCFLSSTSLSRVIYVEGSILNGNGNGQGTGDALTPYLDLQYAIEQAQDGDTLLLNAGVYSARPESYTETLCGNALEHRTSVDASRGFLIQDKGLHILGSGAGRTTLITNAGYGVLFLNSRNSVIENLAVTGGKRDPDGNATDAGIVAKFSTITVRNVHVRDNTDRIDTVVVGIGGIFGREDSELTLRDNQISNNGWDGIALYRGATAYIADNVIKEGRGAGIGITWDATAMVLRNRISGYWKGIGTFGASRAVVSNNLVKDCLGWGIIATGDSYLDATNNNVIHIGNCGLAIWSASCRGRFINNIVTGNGWRDQWVAPQVGVWNNGNPTNFVISHNNVWNNVAGNYGDMDDLTEVDGNISADPGFAADDDYHLKETSPCIDSGSPLISEGNGSISDMGMYGGPNAR